MQPTTEQIVEARGKCSKCNGSRYVGIDDGITNPKDCNDCNGTGNATFETSEVVEVPRGYEFKKIWHNRVEFFNKDCQVPLLQSWHHRLAHRVGHVETWGCEECGTAGKHYYCVKCNNETDGYRECPHCGGAHSYDVICNICNGKGTLSAEVVWVRVEEIECPECRGKKYFCEDYGSEFDCDEENVRCEDCGFSDPCSDCNGSGKVTRIIYTWRERI